MNKKQSNKPSDCSLPTPFAGVFSERSNKIVGFGGTKKKEKMTTYWYVERDEEGETFIQPLNANHVPTGKKRRIACEEVLRKFHPEPGVYTSKVLPQLREMEAGVNRGDRHRKKGELYSAEFEYDTTLRVDEDHIRANFGLGLTYLERGETKKASVTFNKIVTLEDAFEAEHKHLFNDFGIKLRENGMYDEALQYYTRALDLCGWDDHLLFNISRAHYEKNNLNKSYAFLLKTLKANPDLEEALKLKAHLLKKKPGLASMDALEQGPAPYAEESGQAGVAGYTFNF
jgi:tetratricopeptide (TPR) repeat protein